MKCPACGYIGFEATDRCRNCGYEFPQPAAPAAPDLAIKDGADAGGPLRELDMKYEARAARALAGGARVTGERPDLSRVLQNLDRVIGGPEPPTDLPLFGEDAGADLPPLVSPSATPRRPLAVRRTTPDPARLKARAKPRDPAPFALELPLPDRAATLRTASAEPLESAAGEGAPPARRAMAAAIDFVIIAGIDATVLSFTLRLCGLTLGDLAVLPAVPFAGFLALMNGGYFAVFTAAGGQTIGKMALGLRVVGTSDGPVGAGSAVLRALGCLVSVVSFGLGFVPALLADGGRALEDRLADTHVIRVPAA